jgi:hypothetical protein
MEAILGTNFLLIRRKEILQILNMQILFVVSIGMM